MTLARPDDRRAERAECDRRGIGDQRQPGRRERREAKTDQDRARYRDRRTEAGCALEKRAERKCDQQKLQSPVARHAADRPRQDVERARRNGQPVKKDDIEHDPADREEPGHGAKHRRSERKTRRHGEQEDRHQNRDDQRNQRRKMRFHPAGCDQHEERHHRQCSRNRRHDGTAERIVNLIPHGRSLPRRSAGLCRRLFWFFSAHAAFQHSGLPARFRRRTATGLNAVLPE